MLTLIINTASRHNELMLCSESEIIEHTHWESQRDEAQTLLPYIKNLLSKHQQTLHDLTHIVVVNGPGGFTSIRVGVAIANALAYSLDIPISSLSLFDWWKYKIDEPNVMFVSSATGESVFVQGFGKYTDHAPTLKLTNITQVNVSVPLHGELIEKHLDTFEHFQSNNLASIVPKKFDCQGFSWKKESIEPLYGRSAV